MTYSYIGKDLREEPYLRLCSDDFSPLIKATPELILKYIKELEYEIIVATSYLMELKK